MFIPYHLSWRNISMSYSQLGSSSDWQGWKSKILEITAQTSNYDWWETSKPRNAMSFCTKHPLNPSDAPWRHSCQLLGTKSRAMDWLRILLTPLKVNSIPLASWLILSGFLASRQEYFNWDPHPNRMHWNCTFPNIVLSYRILLVLLTIINRGSHQTETCEATTPLPFTARDR